MRSKKCEATLDYLIAKVEGALQEGMNTNECDRKKLCYWCFFDIVIIFLKK